MENVLRAEGLVDLEFCTITFNGPTWESHASDYEKVNFPVMPDTDGVTYIYGAEAYDVILIDKQGRLVTKVAAFTDDAISRVNQRIRELHAE